MLPTPPFPGAVLVETHAHTKEVSGCGRIPAAQLAALVKQAGYGGLVVTDHYLADHTATDKARARFAEGYARAKDAGEALGLSVLPGMELRFAGQGWEDYLVFLPDASYYKTLKGIAELTLPRFYALAEGEGLLVYQAHPFRGYIRCAPPQYLHGVEVHNGNPTHEDHNEKALAFAREQGLRMSSGSDLHIERGVGTGGLWLPGGALTPRGFVEYLRATPAPALYTPEIPEEE